MHRSIKKNIGLLTYIEMMSFWVACEFCRYKNTLQKKNKRRTKKPKTNKQQLTDFWLNCMIQPPQLKSTIKLPQLHNKQPSLVREL